MLRKLGIVLLILIAIPVGWIGSGLISELWNSYTHRYRLTLEVDTPDGIKSGSSVIQVTVSEKASWLPQTRGVNTSVQGEAVFVDLGQGRNVIAVLAFGPTASEQRMNDLAPRAFNLHRANWYREAPRWGGRAELHGDLIPTLVTFSDLNDAKTARIIQPYEFPDVFGEGVRFRGATVEMTGDAVTRGIEDKMPKIMAELREQAKISRIERLGDPFRVNSGHFKRGL